MFITEMTRPVTAVPYMFRPPHERKQQMTERACKEVLISRQTGSGGSHIGHLVAQDLGFSMIVHEAARRLVMGREYAALRERRSSSLIKNVLAGRVRRHDHHPRKEKKKVREIPMCEPVATISRRAT